jgi:S1-C subfamily serine protease
MRRSALLLILLLASCGPAPEPLATIESVDAGLSLRELPAQTLKALGLPYGLAVVKSAGIAERAGLRIGDVIYGVNQDKVKSLAQFNQLLAREQATGQLGLLVRRGRTDVYVAVDLAADAPKASPPPRETLLRT